MTSILIIDGDPASRKLMAAALRSAGHRVRVAADGPSGLAAFSRRPADAIVCEVLQPHLDGLDIIEHLCRSALSLPILAVTGGSPACNANQLLTLAKARGATGTLCKPFSGAEFLAALSDAMFGTGLFRVRPLRTANSPDSADTRPSR